MRAWLSRLDRWPAWIWWTGLALIFLIRFPVHFLFYPPYLMDFDVYRAIAVRIAQGGAHELYAPTASALMMFKYAPVWALAWLPLAWCPAQPAAILWSTLTVGWLLGTCWGIAWLCRRAGLRLSWWMIPAAIALLVRPITAEFLNGQVDLLWAWLVIGFLIARATQQHFWAGACLALAISLKLPAGIFLPYLLARRQWRLAALTGLMLVAMNLAACVCLTPDHPLALLRSWAEVLVSSGTSRAFEIGNQSLLALAGRLLTADGYRLNMATLSPHSALLAMLFISALLFIAALRRPSSDLPDSTRWVFDGALLTTLMVLCSPTTWVATYSALLLPASLALACAAAALQDPRRRLGEVVALTCMGALSAMTHSGFWRALGVRYFRNESYVFLVLMVLPWLGLALFGYLAHQRRRPGASLRVADGDTSRSSAIGRSRPSRRQRTRSRLPATPA